MIDRLAQEGHLHHAGLRHPSAFLDDVVRGAVDLCAAGVGDHAVGTELVAAPGDTDVCALGPSRGSIWIEGAAQIEGFEVVVGGCERGRATRGVPGEGGPILQRDLPSSLHLVRIHDQGRELVQFPRAAEKIDLREPTQHVQPVSFRHAAEDADDEILAVSFSHACESEAAVGLVFRVLSNAARVVEQDLGFRRIVRKSIPERLHMAFHELAVELVHLASEGFEVHRLHVIRSCIAVGHPGA